MNKLASVQVQLQEEAARSWTRVNGPVVLVEAGWTKCIGYLFVAFIALLISKSVFFFGYITLRRLTLGIVFMCNVCCCC